MIRLPGQIMHNRRGFTLLEVILVASLAALVLLAALEISWRVWNVVGTSRENFNEDAELRNAVYWVTRDLRRTEAVNTAIPGKLVISTANKTIVYMLDNESLTRNENNSQRIVAKGITAANFSAKEQDSGILVTAEFRGQKRGIRTCVLVHTRH